MTCRRRPADRCRREIEAGVREYDEEKRLFPPLCDFPDICGSAIERCGTVISWYPGLTASVSNLRYDGDDDFAAPPLYQ